MIAGTPADENELVAAQLKRLDSALDSNERERARLLDAYQAGLIELDELTRRTAALTSRRDQLAPEKTRSRSAAPSSRPRTACAAASLASPSGRRLPRRTRLRRPPQTAATRRRESPRHRLARRDPPQDPLPDDRPGDDRSPAPRARRPGPSSDMRLRSVRDDHVGVVQEPVDGRGRDALGHQFVEPGRVDVGGDRD